MSELEKITLEQNYRVLYGKTFTALLKQYGPQFTSDIEDAVQNAFVRLMKSWGSGNSPEKLDAWLFISAKNDLLNQIKKNNKSPLLSPEVVATSSSRTTKDLRLATLLYLADLPQLSEQVKTIFILKNIFGLGVGEISDALLIGQEAIYKSSKRASRSIEQSKHSFENHQPGQQAMSIVENILLAVFNIGFDSFDARKKSLIDEDLCLEALALAKLLEKEFGRNQTQHLIALFCFHLSRKEAKVKDNKMVSFLDQDRQLWNQELIHLGFHYLKPAESLNRFYLEALIISKYMSSSNYDEKHWKDISSLYQLLYSLNPSPIIKLNLAYALYQSGLRDEASQIMNEVTKLLAADHTYLKLVQAELFNKNKPELSKQIIHSVISDLKQEIRRDFLREKT